MHITDPVADMLTRIRNANNAKHETVDVPASNMKKSIAQILLDEGYITNVAVRPDCRKQGVAGKLLQVFLDFAQANHLAFLTLEVRASNYGAIALYGSRGFRSVGRRKNYYEHPKEDAIIMTKEFTDGTEDPDTGAAADGL